MFTEPWPFYGALYHLVDYDGATRKLHDRIQRWAPTRDLCWTWAAELAGTESGPENWYDVDKRLYELRRAG